jgi:hypothetical protein
MKGWRPIASAPKDRNIVCSDGVAMWLDRWFDLPIENWICKIDRDRRATMWADIPPLMNKPRLTRTSD